MKYFFLFFFIVFVPLVCTYVYQRNNPAFAGFTWGDKNRKGVWIAISLALFVLFAQVLCPEFIAKINAGWKTSRGRDGGEIDYCLQWLLALELLIFPHVIKRSYWAINPTARQYYSRFKCNGYWYAGWAALLLPVITTWQLIA